MRNQHFSRETSKLEFFTQSHMEEDEIPDLIKKDDLSNPDFLGIGKILCQEKI